VALSRAELRAAAKSAIAREAQMAPEANNPRAIAVLPMTFSGTDQTLAPLSRGMSDLLINDLARSPELQLLEREQIQAMVDEIALSQSGRVDAATSLRAGKLVRASRVVQGAITQTGARNLTVNAAVMSVASAEQQGKDVQSSDVLDQIFAIEKTIALGLFDQLGVRLSAADRAAIEQRPTRSLQAFLAYSNGLVAEDEGRFGDAARFYEQARSIDPGFGAALQKAQGARAAQAGAQVTAATVESNLKNSTEGASVTTSGTGIGSTLASAVGDINPSAANNVNTSTSTGQGQTQTQTPPTTRDPASEKTGTDAPATKTGTFTIVIRRPYDDASLLILCCGAGGCGAAGRGRAGTRRCRSRGDAAGRVDQNRHRGNRQDGVADLGTVRLRAAADVAFQRGRGDCLCVVGRFGERQERQLDQRADGHAGARQPDAGQ
jgi:TolB-like protein